MWLDQAPMRGAAASGPPGRAPPWEHIRMPLLNAPYSIRKVLCAAMGVVFVVVAVVEAYRYRMAEDTMAELTRLASESRELQEGAGEMKYIVTDIQRLAIVSILAGDRRLQRFVPAQANRFYDLVGWLCYREQEESPEVCRDLQTLKLRFGEYVEHLVGTVSSVSAGRKPGRRKLAEVDAAFSALMDDLQAVSREISIQSRQAVRELRQRSRRQFRRTILLLSPIPIVFILVFWFLERHLTRPFKAMMAFFRRDRLEDGELYQRLDIDARGEIGELARGVNRLLDSLERTTVSHARLLDEVEERKQMEQSLRDLQGRLEVLVGERTRELRDEVAQRKKAEIEQMNAKERLQESLDYVHSIVENLPVCVKLVDRNGVLLDMNPAGLAMIGAESLDAVVGRTVYPLVAEADRDAYIRFNEMICAGGRGELAFAMRRLDGEERRLFSIAVPFLHRETGEFVQLGIARDMTDSLRAEEEKEKLREQLRHVQQLEAIGTLAGGIAHDFNNILTGIMGFAELAALDAEAGSRQERDIKEILKAGTRAKELVGQLLSISRAEDSEFMPHRLHVIVKEGVKLLRSSLPASIEIRQNIDTSCPPVLTDPTQIHQVLMNLATNAYHAMGDAGRLEINLMSVELPGGEIEGDVLSLAPGRYVVLEVRDTGSGMDALTLKRIFEPYFTTKDMEKGAGLGLATVHGIVRRHQGEVTVASTPGRGTVFRVYLPCLSDQEAEEEKEAGAARGGGERILLVDDEEANLRMTERMLAGLGYTVSAFSSSREALAAYRREPEAYDLVVTDMSMPEMTGEELSRHILASRPGAAIILCTGFSEVLTAERAREIGIREYLMKPYVTRDLAEAVRRALSGRETEAS